MTVKSRCKEKMMESFNSKKNKEFTLEFPIYLLIRKKKERGQLNNKLFRLFSKTWQNHFLRTRLF